MSLSLALFKEDIAFAFIVGFLVNQGSTLGQISSLSARQFNSCLLLIEDEDCRSCHDVRRLIALGNKGFNKKSELMRGSLTLSFNLQKRMVKAFVWRVALYRSETWTL